MDFWQTVGGNKLMAQIESTLRVIREELPKIAESLKEIAVAVSAIRPRM
jgi:hypothetical protein